MAGNPDRVGGVGQGALLALSRVRAEYLQVALDTAQRDYGSIDDYLFKHCGLTAARQQKLRESLLA